MSNIIISMFMLEGTCWEINWLYYSAIKQSNAFKETQIAALNPIINS